MTTPDFARIEAVDGVIIGGGIAGVAIAEYLTRHTSLRLKLLEEGSHLGAGASGKLEGWFHTGGLYAGQDDGQTFMNCVNSVEDLINHYSDYFGGRCNLTLTENQPQHWQPQIVPQKEGWFNTNPVYLIHPRTPSPELHCSGLKGDEVQLNLHLKRVLGRLAIAYGGGHNWLQSGRCLAPSYAQVENHEGRACPLLTTVTTLGEYCRHFDQSWGLSPTDYALIHSFDRAMDTYRIFCDLVASGLSQGLQLETGITLEHLNGDRYGPVRLKSVVYRNGQGELKYLKAQFFIFATGAKFTPFLQELQVRAQLKRSLSAMILAYPALSNYNFVRMSTKNPFHFNHFLQSLQRQGQTLQYSMLANSGYSNEERQETVDIEPLLETAERYFGSQQLYDRQLWSYTCTKTEFISDDEQKRRYSYWLESAPQSNYLCVLPGKFSFFPTVALQAFQRLKTLMPLPVRPAPQSLLVDAQTLAQAEKVVALPYPQQLISSR